MLYDTCSCIVINRIKCMLSFFSSMSSQIHNDSENGIIIIFFAEASDPFLTSPSVDFGIAFEDPYNKQHPWTFYSGKIER